MNSPAKDRRGESEECPSIFDEDGFNFYITKFLYHNTSCDLLAKIASEKKSNETRIYNDNNSRITAVIMIITL